MCQNPPEKNRVNDQTLAAAPIVATPLPHRASTVVRSPESLGGSGLVVIRSFCRFPPLESELAQCRRPDPLYFYDVASATCLPFYGGYCQRSRNRFRTAEDCMKTCVVSAQGFVTKSSMEETAKDRVHGLIRQLSQSRTAASRSPPPPTSAIIPAS